MREQLHSDDDLAVFLTIEDDEIMRLIIESKRPDDIDLTVEDEVIAVVDGKPAPIEAGEPARAAVRLGPAEEMVDRRFGVMLRVYEFFEGWEFGEEA